MFIDGLRKSRKCSLPVTPAFAGVTAIVTFHEIIIMDEFVKRCFYLSTVHYPPPTIHKPNKE